MITTRMHHSIALTSTIKLSHKLPYNSYNTKTFKRIVILNCTKKSENLNAHSDENDVLTTNKKSMYIFDK